MTLGLYVAIVLYITYKANEQETNQNDETGDASKHGFNTQVHSEKYIQEVQLQNSNFNGSQTEMRQSSDIEETVWKKNFKKNFTSD